MTLSHESLTQWWNRLSSSGGSHQKLFDSNGFSPFNVMDAFNQMLNKEKKKKKTSAKARKQALELLLSYRVIVTVNECIMTLTESYDLHDSEDSSKSYLSQIGLIEPQLFMIYTNVPEERRRS